MTRIQTVKFQNPDYGDIYTAQFQKNGKRVDRLDTRTSPSENVKNRRNRHC